MGPSIKAPLALALGVARADGGEGRMVEELRARVLPRSFYDRRTEGVARELLGKVLVAVTPDGVRAGRVVEDEAYLGLRDPASHIGRGFTPRTTGVFGHPGMVYVYFVYGKHFCVNAVTLARPPYGAVLIRAVEPLASLRGYPTVPLQPPRGPTNGPGRLTRALGIGPQHNRGDFVHGPLVLLDLGPPSGPVGRAPRVGVTRATTRPLRFFLRGNPHVSPPRPWGGRQVL